MSHTCHALLISVLVLLVRTGAEADDDEVVCVGNKRGNTTCTSDTFREWRTGKHLTRIHVVIGLSVVCVVTDLLCVIIWWRKYSSASEFFLLMMSLHDLLHSVFKIIESVMNLTGVFAMYPYGAEAVLGNLNGVTFHNMTFMYLALVLERHLAFANMLRDTRRRMTRAKSIAFLVFVVLASLAFPNTVMYGIYGPRNEFTYFYHRFAIITFRLLPWLCITVFNGLLLNDMKNHRIATNVGLLQGGTGTGITFCVTVQTIASIVTYPVAQIWRLVYLFADVEIDDEMFYTIFIFQLQHHIVNFFVYIVLVKGFRRTLIKFLRLSRWLLQESEPHLGLEVHTFTVVGIKTSTREYSQSTTG